MIRSQTPRISVVIPTFNRAGLLRASLESLTRQSLPKDEFEVVVVSDGSSDDTELVCREFQSRVHLRYHFIKNSGISAAKNLGIFVANSPLLFFFDDDDVAMPNLLEVHLEAHQEHSGENIAILGYTDWDESIEVTPVMNYIINVGQQLFAYQHLKHGQILDHTYFWGGRSSCKRSFLTTHGIFNQSFRGAMEDIELGFRLSTFQLKVIYYRTAVSRMIRPITFDDFCRRCQRQGTMLFTMSRLHPNAAVERYCRIKESLAEWQTLQQELSGMPERIRDLELQLAANPENHDLTKRLHTLYHRSFNAYRAKGIAEAAG